MAHDATWEEPISAELPPRAVLLEVLRYEELLTPRERVIALPDAPSLVIGRGADTTSARIAIDDPFASSRHAELRRSGGDRLGPSDVLVDLGSRNGVYVNGQRVVGSARLIDGDLVEIGHTLLCYRLLPHGYDGAFRPLGPTRTRAPELVAIARDLERIAPTREPVLLLGETGVGKDVIARAVHAWSGRRGAFVAVDCGAVPEGLFESTFFGHQRGAFTGASEAREGEIARADKGTLLLDEVANTSAAAQAKLLRAIEEGSVRRVGDERARSVDVRWIAATNSDRVLDEAAFRPDLLRRLAGIVVRVPPLRRRREDLGELVAHILAQLGRERASIAPAAARRLFGGNLAGNVRQLRNVLRAAAVLAGDQPIGEAHVRATEAGLDEAHAAPESRSSIAPPAGVPATIDAHAVSSALEVTGGNVVRAAERLGTHPRQLYRYIERFGIPLDRLRSR
jgi:sigma54-dependent transcription regulator